MDTTIKIDGSWDEQKANLKRRFAILTNSEIIIEQAKKKDMFDKLQIEVIKTNDQLVDWKERLMLLLKNTFLFGAIILATNNTTSAQSGKLYLKDESKTTTTIDMITSQYGDGTEDENYCAAVGDNAKQPMVQSIAVNVVASDKMFGDDKYLKTKEAGKNYTEFQVMDVKSMDKKEVMRGMMTGSLDRDTRYNDNGEVATKTSITVINGTVSQKDANGNVAENAEKVNVSGITFKDKVFVIAGKNDYRYMDGKPLTGGQKLIDELMKGKPVTESTFYFQLKNAGIIKDGLTLTQFTKMDLNQQQQMLNGVALAAAF